MNILTFSSLYPNSVNPQHGIFVETRLRKLLDTGEVSAQVIAPVPHFPFPVGPFRRYAPYDSVPRREILHGIDIRHPRFTVLPKVGMRLSPGSMVRGARTAFREIVAAGKIDLVDAHYFYPDGVAAAVLAAEAGIPCVITGRGSDLNVFPDHAYARRRILGAVESAAACITVSDALRARLTEIGAPADKVVTLRNGVDTEFFSPVDRNAARAKLDLTGTVILAVGNIAPEKGQALIVEALSDLPGTTLVLVGDGADADNVARLAADRGVADRVRMVGRMPQDELPDYYTAADVSVLASVREGWPNVLLESMACGTPVVATDVGGVREIVTAPEAGRIVPERSAGALAASLRALLADPPDRAETRLYAEGFGWDETTRGQIDLFRRITGR